MDPHRFTRTMNAQIRSIEFLGKAPSQVDAWRSLFQASTFIIISLTSEQHRAHIIPIQGKKIAIEIVCGCMLLEGKEIRSTIDMMEGSELIAPKIWHTIRVFIGMHAHSTGL